jgi:hypothetical protein
MELLVGNTANIQVEKRKFHYGDFCLLSKWERRSLANMGFRLGAWPQISWEKNKGGGKADS